MEGTDLSLSPGTSPISHRSLLFAFSLISYKKQKQNGCYYSGLAWGYEFADFESTPRLPIWWCFPLLELTPNSKLLFILPDPLRMFCLLWSFLWLPSMLSYYQVLSHCYGVPGLFLYMDISARCDILEARDDVLLFLWPPRLADPWPVMPYTFNKL